MIAVGLVIGALGILWAILAVGGGGGTIFAIIFFLIIALPLVFGGLFVLSRAKQEEQAEAEIVERRRTLQSESLSRVQLADRLARQHDRLQSVLRAALPASNPTNRLLLEDALKRLEGVTAALRSASYERVGVFDTLAADASDAETVRSIDAALDSGTRALEEQVTDLTRALASGQPNTSLVSRLSGTISRLENATNERSRVLTSGEEKPLPTVAELLSGPRPTGVQEPEKFTQLKPNDALTYDGTDYVITGRLEWSEGGKTWYTYLLGGGPSESWLLVEQGGTQLGIMRPTQVPPDAGSDAVEVQGARWPLAERGTATVTVTGATGTRGGLFVGYRKYTGESNYLWVEEWDEGPKAMLGKPEHAENVELWIR